MTKKKVSNESAEANQAGSNIENNERRNFIKVSAAATVMAAVGSYVASQKVEAAKASANARSSTASKENSATKNYWEQEDWRKGPPRTILGYCWPWTARPGKTLDFKVSTYAKGDYQADLVRVIHGNYWPAQKMQKEIEINAPFAGRYSGRYQKSAPGSFVEIDDQQALPTGGSFTVQTYVFPGLILNKDEKLRRYPQVHLGLEGLGIEDIEEELDEQTLVARWDEEKSTGWSLYLDRLGRVSFKVADHLGQVHKVLLPTPLLKDRWFLVAASYDAENNQITVSSEHVNGYFANEYAIEPQREVHGLPNDTAPLQKGVLRFGATTGRTRGGGKRRAAAQVLNGKLDSVRFSRGVLSSAQVRDMASMVPPRNLADKIIGFWDFGKGIGTTTVHDLSAHKIQGETVNLPDRGVVGVHFDGASVEWTVKPEHYSACAFHDDDLYDAEWDTDFSYTIPEDLPSGIYAARLKHGNFIEHIPFFVAPPRNKTNSKVAYLVSTVSYTAYSNIDEFIPLAIPIAKKQPDGSTRIEKDYSIHPSIGPLNIYDSAFYAKYRRELGGGVYRNHTQGDYHWHATQKVPNLMLKLTGGYTKLCMDTYLTDWLHAMNIEVDVITDDLLQAEGVDLLQNYNVVLNGHHPEYYSSEMLDAVEAYLDQGGRWMYLGGNGYCWNTPFHKQFEGVVEVRKDVEGGLLYGGKYWGPQQAIGEFDGRQAGHWCGAHRPEQRTVGVGWVMSPYTTFSVPYKRAEAAEDKRAAFIFEGVDDELLGDFGWSGNGAAGFEVDAVNFSRGTPSHALVVASSVDFGRPWHFAIGGLEREEYEPRSSMPRADMTFFETTNGGAVFSVGSMSYIGSLSHNNYDNNISRITSNVLKRFADDKPFDMPEV